MIQLAWSLAMSQVAEMKVGLAQILVLYPVTLGPFYLS